MSPQTLCASPQLRYERAAWLSESQAWSRRHQKLVFKHNMYKLREERNMKPSTFAEMVSSTLYEKRSAYFSGLGHSRPRMHPFTRIDSF